MMIWFEPGNEKEIDKVINRMQTQNTWNVNQRDEYQLQIIEVLF